MDITFTRTGIDGGACKATAVRDDGVTVAALGSPGRRDVLPHDLVHYVVESELRLERGFWGRVAAGVLVGGMMVTAGQQKIARHRSRVLVKQAKREGNEIEWLVGSFMALAHKEIGPYLHLHRERVSRFSADEISRTIAGLLDAQGRWQNLRPGESMTVTWPVGLRARKNRLSASRKKTLIRSR